MNYNTFFVLSSEMLWITMLFCPELRNGMNYNAFSPNRVRGSSVLRELQSRLEFQIWRGSMKRIPFQQKSTYFASRCSHSDSLGERSPLFFTRPTKYWHWFLNDLLKRYYSNSKCMSQIYGFWKFSIKPQRRSKFCSDFSRSLKRYYSKSKSTSDAETLL